MELYSIKKVAARLGVHPDTIRKWESRGLAHSIRTLGGHRRYSDDEVKRLEAAMQLTTIKE